MLDVILVTSDRLNLFLIKSSSFFDVFTSLCIFIIPGNMEDFPGFARNLDLISLRLHVCKNSAQQLGEAV